MILHLLGRGGHCLKPSKMRSTIQTFAATWQFKSITFMKEQTEAGNLSLRRLLCEFNETIVGKTLKNISKQGSG
jgi:hypothetical protein